MRVYTGQTRSASLIERLTGFGWGEMTTTRDGGAFPPRRRPWAYDNGAYSDWTHGRAFDAAAFERDVNAIQRDALAPDFIVVPDIVAGGDKSLEFSCAWAPQLVGIAPLYLAVQDGMTLEAVGAELEIFDGIFVGGTLAWKVANALRFRTLAATFTKPCHVGRCGTPNRVRWAKAIKADSIDSCLPLWSEGHLTRFREALDGTESQAWLGENDWGRRVAEGMGAKRS